ncbi:MAG: hypothetical protein GF330_11590 [Candidatus Eisenbacteria bacterium]|nr:hypothetical protein [Candidatus Eisenbacteria bacterium]
MSNRNLTGLILLVTVGTLVLHALAIQPWMLDDAFISFRYAENWAAGAGPVFNPGERVEGYTCFLWVALLALGKALGWGPISLSRTLGFVAAVATLLLLANAHRFTPHLGRRPALIAALFLGTCGIWTAWPASGMEVTLFTFLVLLAVLLHLRLRAAGGARDALLLGAIAAAAALTRPEGLLVSGILFLDLVILALRHRRMHLLWAPGLFLLIYVPYYAWRFSYYGYPLPNSFYAKVGFTLDQVWRGLRYMALFTAPALLLLVPGLAAIVMTGSWSRRYRGLSIVPLLVGIYVVYVILVGGDIMPAYRFLTPVLPLISLVAAAGLWALARSRRAAWIGVVVIAVYNLAQLGLDVEIHDHLMRDRVAEFGREAGEWLAENAPPDAVIATNTAGSVPYFSKLRAIDMLGINDETIAHRDLPQLGRGRAGHEKGDGRYVLSRSPDFIQLGSSLGSQYPHQMRSDQEIYNDPEFRRLYRLRVETLPSGRSLVLYERAVGGR